MNVTHIILLVALAFSVQAQSFQDLDFEAANLTTIPAGQLGGLVPISSALPDWIGYIGTVQQSQVLQNNALNGTATIDILGPNWNSSLQNTYGFGILAGNYTVVLESGEYTTSDGYDTSIAQTGTIPADAQSLQFKAAFQTSALSVSFAGNNLPLTALSTGRSSAGIFYTLYGTDISSFAGQTGQLEFTEVYNVHEPDVELDDIAFSPNPVPEPSPLILTGIGGLIFALHRRFQQR